MKDTKLSSLKVFHIIGVATASGAITIFLTVIAIIVFLALTEADSNIGNLIGQKWVTISMALTAMFWLAGSLMVLATERGDA